jgi:predicted O-linked N-acetylglucosamine transferase (SPINDLY family)
MSTVTETLAIGLQHQQAGRLQQAEAIYRQILQTQPNHPDALHLLGVIAHQVGQHDTAISYIMQAIDHNAQAPEYHNNLAEVYRAQGKLSEAVTHYRQAVALRPDYAKAHNNLGAVLLEQGKLDEASMCCQKALAIEPGYPEAHYNLANALRARGKLEEAEAYYRQAVALRPTLAEAHINLGATLQDQGRLAEAELNFGQAVALRPDISHGHYNLANALKARGKPEEAEAHYRQAVALPPALPEAHNNLGNLLRERGDLDEAVACYRQALSLRPAAAEVHHNLGITLSEQGYLEEAVAHCRQALALRPTSADIYLSLAGTLELEGKIQEALESYQHALVLSPNDGIRIRIATILPVIIGPHEDVMEIRSTFDRNVTSLLEESLLIRDPVKDIGRTNFNLAYHGQNDRDLQVKMARLCAKACPSLLYTAPHCRNPRHKQGKQKIRIGFISRFFYNHSVAYTTAGLIANLSREIFHVCVFSFGTRRNHPFSQLIHQKADSSVLLPRDLEFARQRIAAEECDVLVYADIGMEPLTYFLAFSRLAPVQCVLPGHPVTTGIPTVDYFLSSDHLEPADADTHYSEQLIRLHHPPTYYYRPEIPRLQKSKQDFSLEPDRAIYLCPQALFKFHPDFDDVLANILRADPRGVVVLVEAHVPHWTDALRHRFSVTIPDVCGRIRFLPRRNSQDFLRLLAVADVILDTPHFGGGTTTYMALAVGAPVVTLPGAFMRGRVAYACYQRMGSLECVATSPEAYVELAVRLATEPAHRHRITTAILMTNSVLYESLDFIRGMEQFFLRSIATTYS